MTWVLRWKPTALREFSRLGRDVQIRVRAKLEQTLDDPFRYFVQLRGNRHLFRLRIGDHRLVALLFVTDKVVEVRRIAHRSIIYDR